MHLTWYYVMQVLLIGGSTGTMLETLHVVGDTHDGHLNDVSIAKNFNLINIINSIIKKGCYLLTISILCDIRSCNGH